MCFTSPLKLICKMFPEYLQLLNGKMHISQCVNLSLAFRGHRAWVSDGGVLLLVSKGNHSHRTHSVDSVNALSPTRRRTQ